MQLKLILALCGLWSYASAATCLYHMAAYADQSCDGNSLIEKFGQYGGLPPGYYAKCFIVESIDGPAECSKNNVLYLGKKDEGGVENGCTLPNHKYHVNFDGPVIFRHAGTRNIFAINP